MSGDMETKNRLNYECCVQSGSGVVRGLVERSLSDVSLGSCPTLSPVLQLIHCTKNLYKP